MYICIHYIISIGREKNKLCAAVTIYICNYRETKSYNTTTCTIVYCSLIMCIARVQCENTRICSIIEKTAKFRKINNKPRGDPWFEVKLAVFVRSFLGKFPLKKQKFRKYTNWHIVRYDRIICPTSVASNQPVYYLF